MTNKGDVQLTTMSFTAKDIAMIPEPHREFFFCTCMAANEVNMALRLYLMSMDSFSLAQKRDDMIVVQMAFSSMAIVERNVAAKLYEVYYLIKAYLKRTKSDRVEAFKPVREAAVVLMNHWRDQPILQKIKWYRDTAAHHYGFGEINGLGALTKHIGKEDDNRTFEAIMHHTVGSSFYPLVDQLLVEKLVEDGKEAYEQNEEDHREIRKLAQSFIEFHFEVFRVAVSCMDQPAVKTSRHDMSDLLLEVGRARMPLIFKK